MKTRKIIGFFFFFLLAGTTISTFGNEVEHTEEENEKFEASEFILEHISDSHEWHILTKKNGESVALYLPVIIYSKEKGFDIFSSKKLAHGHIYKGYRLEEEGELQGRIVSVNEEGHVDEENLPLDFSMTKTVMGMLFAAIIGLILFLSLARSYSKAGISHPKGIQSFLEPIILFIRDDIAIPNLGNHKYEKFYALSSYNILFYTDQQLNGDCSFSSTFRSQCNREYCCYYDTCSVYIPGDSIQWNQNYIGNIFLQLREYPFGYYQL